jgi:hypothetical protein
MEPTIKAYTTSHDEEWTTIAPEEITTQIQQDVQWATYTTKIQERKEKKTEPRTQIDKIQYTRHTSPTKPELHTGIF